MKLYNTLTRQIEPVMPLVPPVVGVYTCGPTVYDYAHVGHWFTYVRADTLIRTLQLSNLNPNWVMNVTDVGHLVSDADDGEDKLEKGARREGKTAWEVAEFYATDFFTGLRALNILEPNTICKATDHIAEQIGLIQRLEAKGYTYSIDDGVYYDTSKFPNYEDFAQLDLDAQQAGARVTFNTQKRNVADFALWKFSPPASQRDMEWESPWGKGFPGWHIECSAMSMKYLGDTIDIHTGGIDHIPVHHTNEIAQSEAATGQQFAKHWLHGNHVTINGDKISKSLNNGIRLQDVISRQISPIALRLHILESHYRSQSKFTWESLAAAQNRLVGYQAMAALQWQPRGQSSIDYDGIKQSIIKLLQTDLNTPQALTVLSAASDTIKSNLIRSEDVPAFRQFLEFLDQAFGLDLIHQADIDATTKGLIAERDNARDAKDWATADEVRAQLEQQGILLHDTPDGTIWYRQAG